MIAASAIRQLARFVQLSRNVTVARRWRPHTRLFLANDGAEWVLAEEMRSIGRVARTLGIRVASTEHARGVRAQSVFYANQFVLLDDRFFRSDNRVAVSYYHGARTGEPGLAATFEGLRRRHERLQRLHVTHCAMREFVLSSGVDPAKVVLIPIGVDLSIFRTRTPATRAAARGQLGLPPGATVIGSFQKDGVGWGAGEKPKLIKGPDILVEVIAQVRQRVPNLYVLLSGPARGYVRRRLEELRVPYKHVYPREYRDIGTLYHALDVYIVSSREEGGPKAVLEAMASGVPLVTTRVGQAADIVRHGENGWMVDVEDVPALARWTHGALTEGQMTPMTIAARRTAEAHSYDAQAPLWRRFFEGFVAR